ncbi:MAG: C39 family peptidase [Verrucomicrobiota bacterium]
MLPVRFSMILAAAGTLISGLHAQQQFELDCNLDPLVNIPACWDLTPDKLEKTFAKEDFKKNPYFKWLTNNRDRAIFMRRPYSNLSINLTMFGGEVPVEEVVVDFVDGKINGLSVSIYNRGDSSAEFTKEEFDRRFKISGKEIAKRLDVRPFPRKPNPAQGMLTSGWTWISGTGMAVVEHNPEVDDGTFEFLRMRLMRRDAKGAMAAAMQSRSGAAVRLSDLPRNVIRDKVGNTVIEGIPMVDQGMKGYCVVASAQRLFEYYGIPCDQHQLAQIAEADAERGTSSLAMSQALGKIDHRFKTRFKTVAALYGRGTLYKPNRDMSAGKRFDRSDFLKDVKDYVDDGIPLLWSLQLGHAPEEPAISPQAAGGHMRMIIGNKEAEYRIVFTHSWGAGHEKKRMKIGDAYSVTQGLFVMHPTTR